MRPIHLPQLAAPAGPAPRPSAAAAAALTPAAPRRMRHRRAAVMIGVYLLMTAHIVQWRLTGRTVSPAVLSDSMHTLENGQLNVGFIAFCVILLSTLVFGRFMCGWVCHMGALQDLCAWLLRRTTGVRARPFRARLLGYVPAVLALYMFVWPTFKRDIARPLLQAWWPEGLEWIGEVHSFPGFSSQLMTSDMWSRLPTVAVAIPFLLVCGFGTVYFLGSRGLCRYGCPYGGVLMPAERLAPIGIVVDPSRCDGCGRCTAACEAGVRVHEETAAWGLVTSNKCIRSLDCVEACPQDALALRLTRPPLLRGRPAADRPKAVYDLTWREEAVLTGLFLVIFVVIRGLYGIIPMLMDVSIAACATFAAWKLLRLIRERDVRLGTFQLKRAGSLRPAGWALVGAGVLGGAALVQSAAVKALLWRAGEIDGRVAVPRDLVMSGQSARVPPEMRAAAAEALRLYERAGAIGRGGIGLADTPAADVREGWLHLVLGEYEHAEASLRGAMSRGGPTDALTADVARVMLLRGDGPRAVEWLRDAVEQRPNASDQSRDLLAWLLVQSGQEDQAAALLERALAAHADDWRTRARLANLRMEQGNLAEARVQFRRAAEDAPGAAGAAVRHDLAVALFAGGDVDGAVAELDRAAGLDASVAGQLRQLAAEMLNAAGRADDAARRGPGASNP